jgi:phospholipid transport system substrate-binding protein
VKREAKGEGMKRLILVTAILAWLASPLCAETGGPRQSIEAQVNNLLSVLNDKAQTDKAVKEKKIWEIVNGIFDYDELSRLTMGRNWRKLNAAQQKEFPELFSKVLGNVYMDRIMAYTSEKVVFDDNVNVSDGKALVKSRIVTSDKEIPIDYRMMEKDGKWKVYDVVIEGVSLVSNYRSQFNSILTNKSPEDLMETLRKKASEAQKS